MGVCKCKQRNVTNQFCYVCRMNVCESCMVKDHQRCIIKSYVHWLQDSDYSGTCSLCQDSIQTGEVVRLTCYDLFHWDCFNAWALRFAENSPISSYQCPDCKAQVFPQKALVSPVADVIRQRFSTVGWGRRGLGLPLETQSQHLKPSLPPQQSDRPTTPASTIDVQVSTSTPLSTYKPLGETIRTPFVPLSKHQQGQFIQQQQQNAQMQQKNTYSRDTSVARKIIDTRQGESKINVSHDHDDDKYKRKGIVQWIGNILKLNKKETRPPSTKKESLMTYKRMFILLVLMAIGFMTVVYFMSVFGRNFADTDPMLDLNSNPHINVERQLSYDK